MRRLLLVAAVLTLAGCGAAGKAPAATVQPLTPPSQVAAAVPVSVTIPALDITDEVVPVGLDAEGGLDEPDVSVTGWYRLGPKPGDVGRSLLAGHRDWDGAAGAFKRLDTLGPGDTITVKDAGGVERTFVVYNVQVVDKDEYAEKTVPLVFGLSTGRELAAVTCGGRLSGHNYESNVVVLARQL